jgi:hypothetical protein
MIIPSPYNPSPNPYNHITSPDTQLLGWKSQQSAANAPDTNFFPGTSLLTLTLTLALTLTLICYVLVAREKQGDADADRQSTAQTMTDGTTWARRLRPRR